MALASTTVYLEAPVYYWFYAFSQIPEFYRWQEYVFNNLFKWQKTLILFPNQVEDWLLYYYLDIKMLRNWVFIPQTQIF